MKSTFKKITSIMLLSAVLAVSVFAQKVDYSTISFIEDIYNQKTDCSVENLHSHGFIDDKTATYISTWEGLNVTAEVVMSSLVFRLSSDNKQTFLEGWKKILSRANAKHCKMETSNGITYYIYGHVKICNYSPKIDEIDITYY